MAQLFLADLKEKNLRGQLGGTSSKLPGGKAMGTTVVYEGKENDGAASDGFNEVESGVVRRIFYEFAVGRSPREIGQALKCRPRSRPGKRLLGRHDDPRSSRAQHRNIKQRAFTLVGWMESLRLRQESPNRQTHCPAKPKSSWEIAQVPHLRIVSDELWQRVKARRKAWLSRCRRDSNGIALIEHIARKAPPVGLCDAESAAALVCARARSFLPARNTGAGAL